MSKKRSAAKKAPKKALRPGARRAAAPQAPATSKKVEVNITAAKGRPMLTWVGKRPLTQVTGFPAQLVERHTAIHILGVGQDNDSLDERLRVFGGIRKHWNAECWEDQPGLAVPESGGLLFHGDNKEVLAHLLASGYRGKVNLVYIDPPFDSGADYLRKVSLRGAKGTAKVDGEAYTLGEQVQYTDIWTNDNYLQFMYERLLLLKELLAPNGSICVHSDWHKSHHLRFLMDEVLGAENFQNEIIWYYYNKFASGTTRFSKAHDSVLFYAFGEGAFTPLEEKREKPVRQIARKYQDGVPVNVKDAQGKVLYRERDTRRIDDVWRIACLQPADQKENTGFITQKPEELLRRIIQACSRPGDLVLDCFLGAGTTAAVAQKLGRRWIGCDINKGAIQTSVKRLRTIIGEQIKEALADKKKADETLPGVASEGPKPRPAQFGFTVWRVNDYDLQIQHNEAVNLACEHIGIQRTRTDSYFDGTLGKSLVKIIPFGHPLTPLDLEELRRELEARPDEDRNITLVSLGMELAAKAWIDDWNRLRKGRDAVNRIDVIELRTDPKYGKFIEHRPAQAKVKVARRKEQIHIEIEDFISPTIIERLQQQAGILQPKIDDWRAMVDCVMIDTAYDGHVFNAVLADIPEKKTDLVAGTYDLPAPAGETTVTVKIIDMLGEEVLVTSPPDG